MSAARSAVQAVFITVFVGGLLGPVYTVGTTLAGTDPWLGGLSAYVCSNICPGCHGPFEMRGGTLVNGSSRGGKAAKRYCQPPQGTLDEVADRSRYEVPDDSFPLLSPGYAVVLPLVFAAAFGALRVRARRRPTGATARLA